jgi:putative transposase
MPYPTDLSEKQWLVIAPLVGRPDPRGAKPTYDRREIINAILYINKTGCQWRMLPSNFPPWQNVYNHFQRMQARGTWQEVCCKLNELARQKKGETPRRVTSS